MDAAEHEKQKIIPPSALIDEECWPEAKSKENLQGIEINNHTINMKYKIDYPD